MRAVLVLCCLVVLLPHPTTAQRRNIDRQIRENQSRLDSIRQARDDMEAERQRLLGRARN